MPFFSAALDIDKSAPNLPAMSGILIRLVKLYKAILSPHLPAACRYQPTCSSYMIGALEKYGFLKGFWLGLKRIGRCHPWGGHGYDPVP